LRQPISLPFTEASLWPFFGKSAPAAQLADALASWIDARTDLGTICSPCASSPMHDSRSVVRQRLDEPRPAAHFDELALLNCHLPQ
jgi:hypothetical protein